jgi:DNA-3-methyladenine glycosylase II
MPPLTDLEKARRHLARRDPTLKQVVQAVGPCTLRPNPEHFVILVRSIVAQMISTKAAETVYGRLTQQVTPRGLTPQALLRAGADRIRTAGLSGAKALSLVDLAQRVASGALPLKALPALSDEEVVGHLTAVRGIGVWTAEMFLIFSLGRLDVLPVGDLGLRAGVRRQYQLAEMPDKKRLLEVAEPWRPYRSVGTWYLWRSLGGVPPSA